MICEGSNIRRHICDYDVVLRKAHCPICQRLVKITIPDRKMHGNTAKFSKHSRQEG